MTNMPKLITVYEGSYDDHTWLSNNTDYKRDGKDQAEYIRADIADARLQEAISYLEDIAAKADPGSYIKRACRTAIARLQDAQGDAK